MKSDISREIRLGNLPQGYELQPSDVGRSLAIGWGFGAVLKNDIGKRCYFRDGIFQMENDQQRDQRKNP